MAPGGAAHPPDCILPQHWSSGDISAALRQLNPCSTAACEPLQSPYQAVQDIIYSGQEQYRASVAEARAQLLAIETTLRGQLYASYLEQCLHKSPEFRERGRRVGDKILTQLLRMPPGSSQLSQVHYSDAAGAAPAELAHLQRLPVEVGGWLSGVGASDGGAGLASGGYDSALAILDGLAQPILDPFVEGLKEPFVQAVKDYQATMQSTATLAAAGGLVGGIAAGIALGFVIGRFAGQGRGGGGSK